MKKLLYLLTLIITVIQGACFAQTVYDDNYTENENYLKGMEYMENAQYSSAINEFKKAIRTNSQDTSALIGLSNAYNLRAKYYNDTLKETDKAISDIKSALFFNKYFRQINSNNSIQAIAQMEQNLNLLENSSKLTPEEILKKAKSSRINGEFAAAGFDYFRLADNKTFQAEANSALGDIFKIFNRADKAVIFYKNALAADPDNTDIHLKLARAYEEVDDFNSSLKEYSYTLDTSSEREDILNSLEKIWQKKTDENPSDAENHANLGVVLQKEKRYNEALSEYKKAETLNPNNINTKMNIAALYQEQNKYDLALNIYNTVLQSTPNDVKVLMYKAECLKKLKKTDEAADVYKSVLKLEPKNTEAKTGLFSLLKDTMSTDEILSYLYSNVQNSPQNSDAYYEFAYELHKAGKIDDAITYYTQSIKMDSANIDAYINLSQCYRQKQMYSNSYAVIKKAAELAPDNKLVKTQLEAVKNELDTNLYNDAVNAHEKGNYNEAIELYSKVYPQTAETKLGIAAAYQALSNSEKAVEYYNSAMELAPDNENIPYYLAAIYANDNDLEKADKYIKMTLAKNSSHKQAKELAAYISSKKTEELLEQAVKVYEDEKYEEAAVLFDNIIKISPNEANVYYYRALTYDALQKYQKAIEDYKSAVKLSPEMTIAYYSIAVDYDNLENYKSAKEYYKKYIDTIADDNEYKKYALERLQELSK